MIATALFEGHFHRTGLIREQRKIDNLLTRLFRILFFSFLHLRGLIDGGKDEIITNRGAVCCLFTVSSVITYNTFHWTGNDDNDYALCRAIDRKVVIKNAVYNGAYFEICG